MSLSADPKAVAAVLQEYRACITPEQQALLPAACREAFGDTSMDIQTAAVTLLQEELAFSGTPESAALLHEIAHTFAAASTRLAQIHGRMEPTVPKP